MSGFRVILLLFFLSSQSYAGFLFWKKKEPVMMYDIEKSVYNSLTPEQQQHIIEVYKGHEEERKNHQEKVATITEQTKQLSELQKEKEQLLVKIQKLNSQVKSQEKAINNFLTVTQDILEARSGKRNYRERYKREKFYPKIASIKRGFNSTTVLLENDTLIEVSPFEKEAIDAWVIGQSVELEKGEGLVYTLSLTNLDAENSVAAKIKESP